MQVSLDFMKVALVTYQPLYPTEIVAVPRGPVVEERQFSRKHQGTGEGPVMSLNYR